MNILVPYRNRPEQLKEFIPAIAEYLPDADIFVVEQVDAKPFNRGKLINVGVLETKPFIFVAHDVDMLPITADYTESVSVRVVQIAKSFIQKSDYLGGVTIFRSHVFYDIGGYHNDFWHRAEDNEMMFNLKRKGIPVLNRFGIFKELPHERPSVEFDPILWQKAQLPRTKNMLKTCEYQLISKEVKEGYTHLKVLL